MSKVSIYLNFMGNTLEAFNFYKSAFGTDFVSITKMSDVPSQPGQPDLPENEKNMIMNVQLPILGGTVLMGTDMLASMGHSLQPGNNMSINLEPDTKAEADELFAALSQDGSDITPMQDMFWGAYWGSLVDKFGVHWMINCDTNTAA